MYATRAKLQELPLDISDGFECASAVIQSNSIMLGQMPYVGNSLLFQE